MLRAALKKLQNNGWGSFALELIVVFVGIFGALQADSWYQTQIEEQNVSIQLDRIEEDARFLESKLNALLADYDEDLIGFKITLDILDGAPITDDNVAYFQNTLIGAPILSNLNQPISGLDYLIESGDINLIENDQIRNALLNYSYGRNREEFIDTHLQEFINVQLYDFFRASTWQITSLDSELSRGATFDLEYDLDELRKNRSVRDSIGDIARLQSTLRRQTVNEIGEISELIRLLEQR